MLKNYIKIAYRNLLRQKSFSFINVVGLTLGLTACILIGLFVIDEKQFDKHFPDGDRNYRITYKVSGTEGTSYFATTAPILTTTLEQNFPEVENTVKVLNAKTKELFEANDKMMYEGDGILADPTFFEIFPHHFIHGAPEDALAEPNFIVISDVMAEKFFGKENPVGKEIKIAKEVFHIK